MFVERIDAVIEVLEEAKEIATKLDEGKLESQAAIKRAVTDFRAKLYPEAKSLVGIYRDVLERRDSLLEGVSDVQKEAKKEKLEAQIAEMKAKLEAM